ncbi:hypothetical protein HJ01_00294 [Flavobacterium frigoris PS1]|uniref:Uncharacterized protein n=1 Tax=Flavobacterium frigoris (strain PS1) TaxID=1086011 RepID=H7FM97_FLAFP|nr:hypothetical protein HJ01_00294 [Flavobacterium frigoris PS1]
MFEYQQLRSTTKLLEPKKRAGLKSARRQDQKLAFPYFFKNI